MVLVKSTVCLLLIIAFPAALTVSERDGDAPIKFDAASPQAARQKREEPEKSAAEKVKEAEEAAKGAVDLAKDLKGLFSGAAPNNPAIIGSVAAVVVLGITVIIISE